MKFLIAALFLLAAWPVKAERIPDLALNTQYEACMKGPTHGLERQKQAYCQCIRDKLAQWDMQTFMRLAEEMQKTGANTPALQAMAQECFAKSMH